MNRALRRLALAVAACAAGCSGPLTTIAPAPPSSFETTRPATATVCGTLLLGVIPIGMNNRAQVAYERARRSVGALGLTDVKVTDSWSWIFIGQRACTTLEGVGFRDASPAS